MAHQDDERAHRVRDEDRLLAANVQVEVDLGLEAREVLITDFKVVVGQSPVVCKRARGSA